MEEKSAGESTVAAAERLPDKTEVAAEKQTKHDLQDVSTETENQVNNNQDLTKKDATDVAVTTTTNRNSFNKKHRKRNYSARQQKNNRKNWKLIKMNRKKEKSLLNVSKESADGLQQQQQQLQQQQQQLLQSNVQLPSSGGGRKHGHHIYNLHHDNHRHAHYLNQKFNKNLGGPGGGRNIHNKRAQTFSISKFFLPDKRPRKDCIVPPTKFLFGGNISDPLNLNSLQNESENAITPKSSPIPTPPHYKAKIEVIIPPNIYDPLHLMDPVDSVEYEMQLCSPLKRPKNKHRNRKKRKQNKDSSTDAGNVSSNVESDGESQLPVPAAMAAATVSAVEMVTKVEAKKENDKEEIARRLLERDKAVKNMKLELSNAENMRKRRISETSSNCVNYKIRRMDSLDKIVSPVIPQPGGWKRPLYNLPRGERKRSRTQSMVSEEVISPIEADKLEKFGDLEMKAASTATSSTTVVETAKSSTTAPAPATVSKPSDIVAEKAAEITPPQPVTVTTAKPKFGKPDASYQFGNYDRYYGYRNLNENIDVRFKVFTRNAFLFKDKDILDIGCNVGLMAIAVGKNLHPRSVVGIDIDKNLIARARKNLSLYVRVPPPPPTAAVTPIAVTTTKSPLPSTSTASATIASPAPAEATLVIDEQSTEKSTQTEAAIKKSKIHYSQHHHNNTTGKMVRNRKKKSDFYPISFPINCGPIPNIDHFEVEKDEKAEDERFLFPRNVIFKTANYVLKDEALLNCESQQYDLILCLSTTKWIHLNFGDSGLKLAFKRMFNQLRPGGKLILEAQNWASYKKKKKLTETVYNNFKTIEFFPNKFHEYLLSPEVGFSHTYPLGIPRHLSKGFRRPIQLYVKGDFTPSQAQWSDTYNPQTPYSTHNNIYADPMRTKMRYTDLWGGYQTPSFTPSHGLLPTSPYYDPRNTDSYLPSYDTEVQGRSYLFASPQYSTSVWSPPSDGGGSRRKSSTRNSSIRSVENDDGNNRRKHIYPPMTIEKYVGLPEDETRQSGGSSGNTSLRIADEEDSQQQRHIYSTTSSSLVNDDKPQTADSEELAEAATPDIFTTTDSNE